MRTIHVEEKRFRRFMTVLTLLISLFCIQNLEVTVLPGDRINSTSFSPITPSPHSLESLHKRGCAKITNVRQKILYPESEDVFRFCVIDSLGNFFHIESDRDGNFTTILSEIGYENAELLASKCGFKRASSVTFHMAETLEKSGVRKITRVQTLKPFVFIIHTESNHIYELSLREDSSLISLTRLDL